MNSRIRITNQGKLYSKDNFAAYIKKTGENGSIEKHYISKEKQKEVEENGFAYINQPHERIV